jgi:hypothetical protein
MKMRPDDARIGSRFGCSAAALDARRSCTSRDAIDASGDFPIDRIEGTPESTGFSPRQPTGN